MADKNLESELIDDLNTSFKSKSANASANFVLNSSSHVRDWVSTGIDPLDMIISNSETGGFPVGRLIEISGQEGTGKSLLACRAMAATQAKGGIAVYIDTEHAASVDVLRANGVDLDKLVHVQCGTIEDVFRSFDTIINKIQKWKSNKLITIVWDSVAATSTLAEVEGDIGDHTVGLGARTIGKGLRKYIPVFSSKNVCCIFINQLRTKIGVTFGDSNVTPGGRAIPFHASVRLRLTHYKKIKDQDGLNIGKVVKVHTKKNKVAPPLRDSYIFFRWGDKLGAWIDIAETTFRVLDELKLLKKVTAQKYKIVGGPNKDFTRKKFNEMYEDESFRQVIHDVLAKRLIITSTGDLSEVTEHPDEGDDD